jgi:hypothetical protein
MAARVRVKNGWLMVSYTGAELSRVEMATGDREYGEWKSAFLSWDGRDRVAMIRPPQGTGRALKVWLRIDNVAEMVGSVRL